MPLRLMKSPLVVVAFAGLILSTLALFSTGQALLSNGACIRFLQIPFTQTRFHVPDSSPRILLATSAVCALAVVAAVLVRRRPPLDD